MQVLSRLNAIADDESGVKKANVVAKSPVKIRVQVQTKVNR